MVDAFVRLVCPECKKAWQDTPADLPELRTNFSCPGCHATHRLTEFMRTERDLEVVRQFQ